MLFRSLLSFELIDEITPRLRSRSTMTSFSSFIIICGASPKDRSEISDSVSWAIDPVSQGSASVDSLINGSRRLDRGVLCLRRLFLGLVGLGEELMVATHCSFFSHSNVIRLRGAFLIAS